MILSLFNNIVKANNEINNNVWQREGNRGIELENKTVGIIGYGKTGKNFAKKAKDKDLTTFVFDRAYWPYKGKIKAMVEAIREESIVI